MIHFNELTSLYEFSGGNHNVCKKYANKIVIYNQLFVDDKLYVLNTKTGKLLVNQIDLNMVQILKKYNFSVIDHNRLQTTINGKKTKIHEIICNLKTNNNWVINHIDGDPSNNKCINLELVTSWFNTVLMKKASGLPIGIMYRNPASFGTAINMPITQKGIAFCSKSINYLQNLHYQFGTKSGLVTSKRYLPSVPNWLPDNTIQFTPKHQTKLDMLIAAHQENQSKWDKPQSIFC